MNNWFEYFLFGFELKKKSFKNVSFKNSYNVFELKVSV